MAVPGLTDGAGMQAEVRTLGHLTSFICSLSLGYMTVSQVERILEERVEDLSSTKVKQVNSRYM